MTDRTLLLLRHAKAEAGYGVIDYDRALTDRGHDQARRVGRLLAEAGHTPDHVICSAAKRTRQTLEGVLETLGTTPEIDYSESAYTAGVDSLVELITYVDPGVRTLLVVGHNPTIAQLAATFVGNEALVSYSPATVSAVDMEVEWLYTAPGTGSGRILG